VSRQALSFAPHDSTPISLMDSNFLYSVSGRGAMYSGTASRCQSPHTSPVGPYNSAQNAGCSGNSFAIGPKFAGATIPGAPSCSGYATTLTCMAAATAGWIATDPIAARMGFQTPAPPDAL
jgi:hypothetical protein